MPGTFEVNQVGKREDLADIIAIADAKATPFTSMLKKGKKATNTLFECQADKYDDAQTGGVPEGKDVDTYEDAAEYREKIAGRLQKFRRTVLVTTEAQEISVIAGINSSDVNNVPGADEYARAKAKKAIEIKRDMEATFLSDNDSRAEATGQARRSRGVGAWIAQTAQTDLPVPVAYRTPTASLFSGAIGTFTEDTLRGLLESRWDQTGASDELVGIVGSKVKNAVSDMIRYEPNKASNTVVRSYRADIGDKKVQSIVDVYEGDYGTDELFLNSFLPNNFRGYILDMRFFECRSAFMPRFEELPNMGAGRRGMIEAIVGLSCMNPLGQIKIVATA